MRKFLCGIVIFLIFILVPKFTYAEEQTKENILNKQTEGFGISDFIEEANKYSTDVFNDINMKDVFNSAISGNVKNDTIIKKILNFLGIEIISSIKTLVSILVIVLIHTVLKTVTDSLEDNSVSKIIYYVQYILIVTLIFSNFSSILSSVSDTISNLVGFTNSLIPLLITLMIYTGSISTSVVIEPIILFVIEFISNIIRGLILPAISLIVVLIIVSKISDQIQINKLTKFMKSSVVWFLGVVLTIFVGVISLEGTLTSSVDGITAKTTKAAVSNLIPVVGKVLGDSVDTVLGCGLILKNAVGIVGSLVIIGICINPIIKLATLSIIYSLGASIVEVIADKKIVNLLEEISGIFKILLGIMCTMSVMLIIGTTLIIKISNSGMMYR